MKVWLINYDNGSRWPVLPQNLYHLKKCLDMDGIDAEVIDFNLTKESYRRLNGIINESEPYECVIGLGFIAGYWPHKEAQAIAKVINNFDRRNEIAFILGGHGPSADPGYYMDLLSADAVFIGAADQSLPMWVRGLRAEDWPNKMLLQRIIPSYGYRMFSQYFEPPGIDVYKRVRFPNTKDDEFAIQMLSGRGCPNKCSFCYRMSNKYEAYEDDNIIQAVKYYYLDHGITHFQFSDELLTVSRRRLERLNEKLRDLQADIGSDLFFDCNGSIGFFFKYPELLRTMKCTGFRYINFGCESMSNEVLKNIRKHQTADQIRFVIEATLYAGLSPGLNFMWGNPGDDERTLRDATRFLISHNDGCELRTIRPVTPYPGTELFEKLGITTAEFYENHTNSDLFSYNFMDLTNTEANMALIEANAEIIAHHYKEGVKFKVAEMNALAKGEKDPLKFRGFREV